VLITAEEQEVVIKYIAECGNRGFPLSHRRLKEHVNKILRTQLGDKFPIGGVEKKWTNQFIEKYSKL
jgi:Tc5 transposase DNA-binding domain